MPSRIIESDVNELCRSLRLSSENTTNRFGKKESRHISIGHGEICVVFVTATSRKAIAAFHPSRREEQLTLVACAIASTRQSTCEYFDFRVVPTRRIRPRSKACQRNRLLLANAWRITSVINLF